MQRETGAFAFPYGLSVTVHLGMDYEVFVVLPGSIFTDISLALGPSGHMSDAGISHQLQASWFLAN